jgi:hypothetical protein
MLLALHRLFAAASGWHPGQILISLAIAGLAAAFAAVSLGFATLAAWLHLDAVAGRIAACLAISGCYALAAIITTVVLLRWRARSSRRDARDPGQASTAQLEAVLQALAAAGGGDDATAFAAALGTGRTMSPMERLVVALVSGFFAGRKLGR